jgi:hypothetical protein
LPHASRRNSNRRRPPRERSPRPHSGSRRRAREFARRPSFRRSLATFGGSLVSRVGHCRPEPRSQLATSRGGSRWDYPTRSGTSVQSGGQGTAIKDVEGGVVRKRATRNCPVIPGMQYSSPRLQAYDACVRQPRSRGRSSGVTESDPATIGIRTTKISLGRGRPRCRRAAIARQRLP